MKNNINSFSENMRKTIAQQANEIALLSAMQSAITTNDTFVSYNFENHKGEKTEYELPSFISIQNRLKSLEQSLNNLVKGKGTINLEDGSRRTISVNAIPTVPTQVTGISDPSVFTLDTNWFFEDLMFPGATVEIDLTGQIEDSADRVKVVRVILNANDRDAKEIWDNNLSTNSYDYVSLLSLLSANKVPYSLDEEIINLPLTQNTQSGTFEVTKDPEVLNNKVWYTLNSLSYSTISSDGIDQGRNNILSIKDQLSYQDSIFEVQEIDQNSNRVRLRRILGAATPGSYTIFSYYQDPFRSKVINVRFGAHEYDIIYVKGVNEAYNLQADVWSTPIKFSSDSLLYKNAAGNITSENFNDFYANNIVDWGADMIADAKERYIKAYYGQIPNAPTLNAEELRVVQINTQINAAVDTLDVKNTAAEIESVKSQINSLKQTIAAQKTDLQNITNIYSYNSLQEQIATNTTDMQNLQTQYSTLVNGFQTLVKENGALITDPKYHIRGFFAIPPFKIHDEKNNIQEEIIGFDVAYRYMTEESNAPGLNTFQYVDSDGVTTVTGTFSDWNIVHSELKAREYDENLEKFIWETENVADGTQVNINQIDIPIQRGEKVQIKVRSISEAGYPTNCLKSEWSDTIIMEFPDNLSTTNEIADLIQQINDDALQITINNTLNSVGVTAHLSDSVPNTNSVNGMYFYHKAGNIAYENKDEQNNTIQSISVQDKIDSLQNKFRNVLFFKDLSNINYVNYDISIKEDDD